MNEKISVMRSRCTLRIFEKCRRQECQPKLFGFCNSGESCTALSVARHYHLSDTFGHGVQANVSMMMSCVSLHLHERSSRSMQDARDVAITHDDSHKTKTTRSHDLTLFNKKWPCQ